MKHYVYYACGDNVESIKFLSNSEAWEYVNNNEEYDTVVEMIETIKDNGCNEPNNDIEI